MQNENLTELLNRATWARDHLKNVAAFRRGMLVDRTVSFGPNAHRVVFLGRKKFADAFDGFARNVVDEARIPLRPPALIRKALTLREEADSIDVMFVDPVLSPLLGAVDAPRMVPFARARLDVKSSLDAQIDHVVSDGYRRRLKKLSEKPRNVVVGTTTKDFDRFYSEFYAPFSTSRFGGEALLDREGLARVFKRRGRVLFIEMEGTKVAAFTYESRRDPGALYFLRIGAASPPDSPRAHTDMMSFAEVAVFDVAVQGKYQTIDFGLTMSSSRNGIFTHKRRLGADFIPFPGFPAFSVVMPPTKRLGALSAFPFLAPRRDGFDVHMGYAGPFSSSTKCELVPIIKDALFPAVKDVHVAVPADQNIDALRAAVKNDIDTHASIVLHPVAGTTSIPPPPSNLP